MSLKIHVALSNENLENLETCVARTQCSTALNNDPMIRYKSEAYDP